MLINLSNHPAGKWPQEQIQAASEKYGEIVDYSFPQIDPFADSGSILALARDCMLKIQAMLDRDHTAEPVPEKRDAVMCQGEFSFTYALTALLQREGITVISATTRRDTQEETVNGEVIKKSVFRFCMFREYPVIC